jgi:hypothetical protein
VHMKLVSTEPFGKGSSSFQPLDGVLHAFVGWEEHVEAIIDRIGWHL